MTTNVMPKLVDSQWLADRLDAPDLRIVDASWHMPDSGRNALQEYTAGHIPGAVFFDIDEIADTTCDLPHMLPSAEKFASRMRSLGIGDGVRIVIYDASDVKSSARAWWMFKVFGYDQVAILDGGLAKWIAENRPLENLQPETRERHFTPKRKSRLVRDSEQILKITKTRHEQLLDARSPGRFAGSEPETRPNLRAGHIPGARNLHYAQLFRSDGTFRSEKSLREIFEQAGIDLNKPIVTSCGSGVTACVLAFALDLVGHKKVAVYDGSWCEWGADQNLPIETGPAQ